MADFTREELRDVMHAIRHYQMYHISIKNPRYEEYNSILNKLEESIPKATDESDDRFERTKYLNWLERRQREIGDEVKTYPE